MSTLPGNGAIGIDEGTTRRTAMFIAVTALTSLVGFAREVALADRFGTGIEADAWGLAGALVAVATDLLLIAGPIGASAIPLLADQRLAQGDAGERRALSALTLSMLGFGSIMTITLGLGAPWFGHVIAPGFDPTRREALEPLLRWVGASLLPISLAGGFAVALAARRRFLGPSLTGLALHVGVLAGLIWLAPSIGVSAVGLGLFVGSLLALAAQSGALARPGLALPPDWAFARRLMTFLPPVALIYAIREGTLVMERIFATTLSTGELSTLYYAGKLEQLPLGLFGISVSVVAYPDLAELAASGRRRELGEAVAGAQRLILLLAVPSAVGLAVLATPIVRLVLEHGAFVAASTAATASVLLIVSVGLVGQSTIPSLVRAFMVERRTRVPGAVLGSVLALNLLLDLALVRFGALGLAAAFAVTMTLGAVGLAVALERRVPFLGAMDLGRLSVVLAVGSALLGVAAWSAHALVDGWLGHLTIVGRAAGTLSGVFAGLLAYAGVLAIARVPELRLLSKPNGHVGQ